MREKGIYEQFPIWIVIIANAFALLIYLLGSYILFSAHWILGIAYILFLLYIELKIVSKHCIDCYYFGKTCGFGKGRISAWFFKKGDSSRFCAMKITWKNMIPDFLVSLIPVICGIVLMIKNFEFKVLIAVILIVLLTTFGNGFIRGSLTCKFCKQREIGCPADQLFNQKESVKDA